MKCGLNIGRVKGRSLNEAEVVLLSKCLGLVSGHSSQMTEIRLVANLMIVRFDEEIIYLYI